MNIGLENTEFWYATAIVLSALVLVLVKLTARTCPWCESRNTRSEIERSLEWATDVGDVVKADPYWLNRKYRVCEDCGRKTLLKVWTTEIPDDEGMAKTYKEEVMAHDFKLRRR